MKSVVDGQTLPRRGEAGNAFYRLTQLTFDIDRALVTLSLELNARPREALEFAHQRREAGQWSTRRAARDGGDGLRLRVARGLVHNYAHRPVPLGHDGL